MSCSVPTTGDPVTSRAATAQAIVPEDVRRLFPLAIARIVRNDLSAARQVTLGACPFCHKLEQIVGDVDLPAGDARGPFAQVACGECGARGPWGFDDEAAVLRWNEGARTPTTYMSDWEPVPAAREEDRDAPF